MLYLILMYISHFMFLLANGLLLVYFLILDYVNDVRQKQIWTIFLFQFKMGHRTAETTCKINNAFGLGTAIEGIVQWWVKKFWKGDKSLEDEEHSGQPLEVENDQLSHHWSWSS